MTQSFLHERCKECRNKISDMNARISDEEKNEIIEVRRKNEFWYDLAGVKHSRLELAIYTRGSFMQFDLNDPRLPLDIEARPQAYSLCHRRFEAGKPQSRTGLTCVWFEENNERNASEVVKNGNGYEVK